MDTPVGRCPETAIGGVDRKVVLHCLVLAGLVAAVFGRTVGHDFVWDDQIFVGYKETYRNLDLAKVLFSLSANGLEYLPVRDLTYLLDFMLWKGSPAGFHFSNLVYYLGAVVGLYLLATKIASLSARSGVTLSAGDPRVVGFVAAALFAVHPINCEAAAFVTCRNVLVSGMFFFVSCFAYLSHLVGPSSGKRAWYVAALALFVLALFSKATAIVLPVVLLLLYLFFAPQGQRRRWLGLLPFAALAGLAFFFFGAVARRTHVMADEPAGVTLSSLASRAVTAVQIPVFYLGKLVVPRGFSVDYGSEQFAAGLFSPRTLLCLVILFGIAACAALAWRRLPAVAFAAAWFVAALLPVLHLFPTNPVVADRYAFLPVAGVFFLAATAGARLLARRRWWAVGSFAALVLALAATATVQAGVWKSTKSLWEHTVQVSPRSTKALVNLGRHYFLEERNYDQALALFKRAQEIDRGNVNYDLFLGGLLVMRNRPQEALAPLTRAFQKEPQRVETLINLGLAYEGVGQRSRALDFFRRATLSTQDDPAAGRLRALAAVHLRRLGG